MSNDPAFQRALDACAAEPIHIIGAIQPPGVLLVYQRHGGRIVAASANAAELFETEVQALLGQPIHQVVDTPLLDLVSEAIAHRESGPSRLAGIGNVGAFGALYYASAHADGDLVHIELEPASSERGPDEGQAVLALDSNGPDGLLQALAQQVQALSGYSRVMVYQFLHDGSGEVLAEALDGDLPSYLGLRYPASDIPPQARALYLRNRVRAIADVNHTPSPVHQDPQLPAPLDMSYDVLRTVSPVHLEYLRNMGVAASMSISLVVDGKLWGLVACHHHEPREVCAHTRQALDLLGRHASMILDASALREQVQREEAMRAQRDLVEARLHGLADPVSGLYGVLDAALAAVSADGIVLHLGGRHLASGSVPASGGIDAALRWARNRGRSSVACTALGEDWNPADDVHDACGVLALPLGRGVDDWLLLFRREQRRTVLWAGRPDQPFQLDPSGDRVGPRTSFAAWEEQVQGSSIPWFHRDVELAQRLRMVLERALAGTTALAGSHSSIDRDPVAAIEAREQSARLRRLAELLDGASPGRARLQRLHRLLSHIEDELGTLAGTNG